MSIKKTTSSREVALASIPFVFGLQQITEGFIWKTTTDSSTLLINIYLFIAMVFWPAYSPFAIGLVETDSTRKKWIRFSILPAIITSAYYIHMLWMNAVSSIIQNQHIKYQFPVTIPIPILILYCIATLLPALVSSHKWIMIYGFSLFFSMVSSYLQYNDNFASTWCFFSAISSVMIYFHFHFNHSNIS